MIDWLAEHLDGEKLLWGFALFVVTFAASLAVVTIILVQLPAGYFRPNSEKPEVSVRHPILRWTFLIGKNLLGAAVIVLGLLTSLPGIPGQGALTILIGIMLLNFPGKRRFERWLVTRPPIWRSVNRIRERFGKPPFIVD